MLYITDATYISDYKIWLCFNDGRKGFVDLEEIVHQDHRQIFRELENLHMFKDFYLDRDTIVWSNGLDLAPEFLWERIN